MDLSQMPDLKWGISENLHNSISVFGFRPNFVSMHFFKYAAVKPGSTQDLRFLVFKIQVWAIHSELISTASEG